MTVCGATAERGPGNRWGCYYPWGQWFAGGQFTLEHGKDYDCSPVGMVANIRSQAKKRNIRVRIETDSWQSGKMTVTVIGPDRPARK